MAALVVPCDARLSALARKFADVFGLGGLRGGSVESLGEAVEVGAGEPPFEWLRDLLVAAAEREELPFEAGEVREVVGGEDFSLDDREVDLGLVCEHEYGGKVGVEDRSTDVELHRRWRGRRLVGGPLQPACGGGCKPPQGALVKSRGAERCGKAVP